MVSVIYLLQLHLAADATSSDDQSQYHELKLEGWILSGIMLFCIGL